MSFNKPVAGGEQVDPLVSNAPKTPDEIEATIKKITKIALDKISEEVLEYNIGCVQNYIDSANAHIATGNHSDAIMDLATAARIDPTNADTQAALAELTHVQCTISASAHLLLALHHAPEHVKANEILVKAAKKIGTTKDILLQKVQNKLAEEQRRAEYNKRRCTTRPDTSTIQACSTNY